MKPKKNLLATLASLLISYPTLSAQELTNWSGPYVGISIGSARNSETLSSSRTFAGNVVSPKKNSANIGISIGNNTQKNNVIIGFELDFGTNSSNSSFSPDQDVTSISRNIKALGHLRGRIGYAYGRILPYASVGLACAKVDHRIESITGDAPDSDTNVLLGASFAVGMEYAVSPAFKIRGEYTTDRFSSASIQAYDAGDSFISKLKIDALKAGFIFKF